ncbi:MAG TPA: di-heme oxidoredictase family protein [Steroidobacteraceae bacterium]|jgi:CxxC motif-containing protein (DUF1111 family)|nr:di-heme oxidoredictase family protein [Steroidobacteraceae bacterium]
MNPVTPLTILTLALAVAASAAPEAPTGFDNKSNGLVDEATHQADLAKFDTVEQLADGLGPLYNAQACRECHQSPVSGGSSQVSELRVGHTGSDGHFHNPEIPIAHGAEVITGRSLVNDRAICPNAAYPNTEIQQRVPDSETIRTTRMSLSLLGDGFVEAVADQTFVDLGRQQCKASHRRICGQVLQVPVVEAPGQMNVGRFGWKDQHASLLSFAADAYLNEIGITNRLQPDEVTTLCNSASEPNDTPGADGLSDIDRFARFVRATKAPARDLELANTPQARKGSELFDKIGCASCHVRSLKTAASGAKINGGTYVIPEGLGSVTFHPYGDFLMHDVGTGDGILQATPEHYGHRVFQMMSTYMSKQHFETTESKMRTAPLWGVRLQTRLMHDGASLTLRDAILRHRGEARDEAKNFERLSKQDQEALIEFLRSL